MVENPPIRVDEDWDYLVSFLPDGWAEQARALGALRRARKMASADLLLRVLLIHLAEGCSLRETAVRAEQAGLVSVSDVAVMDRLRQSGPWFQWMNQALIDQLGIHPVAGRPPHRRVRVVDGTHVSEPGPTGSSWRLHYAIELPALCCSDVQISESVGAGVGESFARFAVAPGDLLLGDRVYGNANGIAHVVDHGGDVLTRFGWQNLPMQDADGDPFDLFGHLRTLEGTRVGDWPVLLAHDRERIPGRVCAVKLSRQARERAIRRARRKSQKDGTAIRRETVEAAQYVFVFTTLPQHVCRPSLALEYYRGRWQIELVFKRMKSILGLGHLRKHDDEACKAWLHGKLFVATLLEALLRHGETFFPWGYPLRTAPES